MSCGNSRSSKCNPCGPSEAAMNAIADRAAYYARIAVEAAGGTTGGKAPVGGNTFGVFYENDQVMVTDYTITTGRNAMSAGPITVNPGVTLTVPSGSTYTIV
jgi:hypothetical protein